MTKKKCKKSKDQTRKRIVEFSWKTPGGYRQSLNENDFYTRKAFLKERRSFKKNGIKIRDVKSSRKYIPLRER